MHHFRFKWIYHFDILFRQAFDFFFTSILAPSWGWMRFLLTRLDKRPLSSRLRLGRGSNEGGQGNIVSGRGLYCEWEGALVIRNHSSGWFCVIQDFVFPIFSPSYLPTFLRTQHLIVLASDQKFKIQYHCNIWLAYFVALPADLHNEGWTKPVEDWDRG